MRLVTEQETNLAFIEALILDNGAIELTFVPLDSELKKKSKTSFIL